jgi:hypothetical protein
MPMGRCRLFKACSCQIRGNIPIDQKNPAAQAVFKVIGRFSFDPAVGFQACPSGLRICFIARAVEVGILSTIGNAL